MKNRIYTIFLLLSFLVVLSHEMIHHHELVADNLFDGQSLVNSFGNNGIERNTTEEHNHPFPLHRHISATSDFVNARTNLQESNPINRISSLFVVLDVFQTDFFEPQGFINNNYKNKALFISSLFNPNTNALRGPPSPQYS